MKTLTINTNSWHFWIAKQASNAILCTDICSYLRQIFKGLIGLCFLTVVIIAFGTITLWPTGNFIGWLIAGLINGFVSPEVAIIFMTAVGCGIIFLAFKGLFMFARTFRSHEPEFVAVAYSNIKDKICYRIDFKDKLK